MSGKGRVGADGISPQKTVDFGFWGRLFFKPSPPPCVAQLFFAVALCGGFGVRVRGFFCICNSRNCRKICQFLAYGLDWFYFRFMAYTAEISFDGSVGESKNSRQRFGFGSSRFLFFSWAGGNTGVTGHAGLNQKGEANGGTMV